MKLIDYDLTMINVLVVIKNKMKKVNKTNINSIKKYIFA